jgi:hypothetical protein
MSYGTERTFQFVIDALRQLEREHVRRLDAVPPLVDIAVSLALMDGGVEAAEEIMRASASMTGVEARPRPRLTGALASEHSPVTHSPGTLR